MRHSLPRTLSRLNPPPRAGHSYGSGPTSFRSPTAPGVSSGLVGPPRLSALSRFLPQLPGPTPRPQFPVPSHASDTDARSLPRLRSRPPRGPCSRSGLAPETAPTPSLAVPTGPRPQSRCPPPEGTQGQSETAPPQSRTGSPAEGRDCPQPPELPQSRPAPRAPGPPGAGSGARRTSGRTGRRPARRVRGEGTGSSGVLVAGGAGSAGGGVGPSWGRGRQRWRVWAASAASGRRLLSGGQVWEPGRRRAP